MGPNEDYSPGGSISDSSEKLLRTDRGEGQSIRDFGDRCVGGVHPIKYTFLQKVAASHEEQTSP